MVIVVVTLNSLIGLGCLYIAWRVWQLRQTLAAIADNLTVAERNTHRVLRGAPTAILKGQLGANQWRQQTRQLQQVQQVLALVSLGRSLVWGRSPVSRPKSRMGNVNLQRNWRHR